jgi:hypothetical protein
MEDKYIFCVKCDDLSEFKIYSDAMKNYLDLDEIYNIARNYGKYQEPTKENYYKMSDEIKQLAYREQ